MEWHREYQRQRAQQRMALAREYLGGRCARCGATEDLDVDHIDRTTKERPVSEAVNWSLMRFIAEVDKCQLLCKECHKAKSIEAGDQGQVPHGGGVSGKHGCPCELCRARKKEYLKQYYRRQRNDPA